MRKTTGILAAAAMLGLGLVVRGEEWPRWRGPEGTGISTEKGLLENWPKDGPAKAWSAKVGLGFSSPIALDGKVYLFSQTGARDTLTSFDAETGKQLWSQAYVRGDDPDFPGTRATPTIDGDRVYTYGSDGDLVSWNLADGKILWRTNVLKETGAQRIHWGEASSPLVAGDFIYVQGGKGAQSVAVAIDKKTGAVAWKSQAKGAAGYSSPIFAEVEQQKQVIVLGNDMVYGMDPANGNTLWSQPWQTPPEVNAATPVFDGTHLFISSGYGHGCMMLTLSAQGAKKEWEQRTVTCKFQAPILDGKTLYANSAGTLKCLSWPDGKELWAAGRDLRIGEGGSIVRNGDNLIAMSERGVLSLIQATPAGYKTLSQTHVFDYSQVWSTPLIYRGKLYVKGEAELICFDISAPKK